MPLRLNTREVVKAGRSALLVRVESPNHGRMTAVAYKRVRRRTFLKRLTVLLRTNRTLRTWRIGHELLRRGIPTARPLAVIVPRRLDVGLPSYVAHEWIEGARNLREWCWWAAELQAGDRRQALHAGAASLGSLLGRMHARNVCHRDLKPGNLMLAVNGREVASYVIDLDGVSLHRRISEPLRWKNLSRVVVGLTELPPVDKTVLLRFLLAYLRAAGIGIGGWKSAWRRLDQIGAVRLQRKLRKAA